MRTSSIDERVPSARSGPTSTDGRTARRDRNRVAVLDAVIELFDEDNLSPGVHEVARRSGVSLRSVYRYFEDLDALIAAAIERQYDLTRHLYLIPRLGEGPLEDRIGRFCQSRIDLFDAVRTVFVAATVRAGTDHQVASGLAWCRRRLTEQVEAMFAPELERMAEDDRALVTLTLDLLTQFDTLELLRHTRAMTAEQTMAYLADTLRAHLS